VHVRHIMKKLGAANRTQAALCAANQSAPAGALVDRAERTLPPIDSES
jgi:hypothetical protein